MKIFPENFTELQKAEAVKTSNELVIDDKKKAEMIAKAVELLGNEAKEDSVLMSELEHFYIFENGESQHYTTEQLKAVVEEVAKLNPIKEVTVIETPVETPIIK